MTTYVLMQLTIREFVDLPDYVESTRGLPKYFTVHECGEVEIYPPKIPHNQELVTLTVQLENRNGRKKRR